MELTLDNETLPWVVLGCVLFAWLCVGASCYHFLRRQPREAGGPGKRAEPAPLDAGEATHTAAQGPLDVYQHCERGLDPSQVQCVLTSEGLHRQARTPVPGASEYVFCIGEPPGHWELVEAKPGCSAQTRQVVVSPRCVPPRPVSPGSSGEEVDDDPELLRAMMIVDSTATEVARIMSEAQAANPDMKNLWLLRARKLEASPEYVTALSYLRSERCRGDRALYGKVMMFGNMPALQNSCIHGLCSGNDDSLELRM